MAIFWPGALPMTAWASPVLEGSDRSGGVSLSGGEQITETPAGRWVMQVTALVHNRATAKAWQSLVAGLGGRAGEILMPVKACLTQPGSVITTRFSDVEGPTTFDDGFGFVEDALPIVLAEAAPLNSTEITVSGHSDFEIGQYIGLVDRAHIIRDVLPLPGGGARLTIAPWTRAAHPAGAPVSTRTTVIRMRLRDAKQLQQPFDMGRFARPTLDFIEAF